MVEDGSTGRQPGDRGAVRRKRRALPAAEPAQRRPRQRAQHRDRGRHGRVHRVRRQRRLPHRERLRAAAGRARRDGLRLRHRERAAPPEPGCAPIRLPRGCVREDPSRHACDEVPAADRRPGRVEQALPALVLGRPLHALPRGRSQRGHPGDRAGALRGAVGRRDRRPDLLLARSRGRPALDHPAPPRAARASRPDRRGGAGRGMARGERPREVDEEVLREPRRGRPAPLPQPSPRCRRGVPADLPRQGQRLPRQRPRATCSTRCRRPSGASGCSSGAGRCQSCSSSFAPSASGSAVRRLR